MSVTTIEGFRLSPQQRRVWLEQRGGPAFRVAGAFRLAGELDRDALARAVRSVALEHEILRTRFPCLAGVDVPVQSIGDEIALSYREIDLANESPEAAEARFEELWREELRAPFEFERGPLLRVTLAVLARGEHLLLLGLPALCADAAAVKNLVDEIATAYGGGEGDGEPVQYADFAEWQNELLEAEDEEGEEGREYWRRKNLAALPAPALTFGAGGAESELAPRVIGVAAAPQVARGEAAVPSHLLACLHVLLFRLTGQEEVAVSRLFDGRSVEQLAGALGLFARYLPVACRLGEGFRFREVLSAVEETVRSHDAWQDLFSWEAGAGKADFPFFGVHFHHEEWPEAVTAGDVSIERRRVFSLIERFRLKLCALRRPGGLELELHYDPGWCEAADADRFARQFATLAASAADDPESEVGELEVLDAAERRQLLADWNRTQAPYPQDACAHHLFAARAAETPAATAVTFAGAHLTYGALDRRANRLARHLQGTGVGPEVPVGLHLERSVEMVVALLAVWKAGGAYVPLDPGLPAERLGFLLADSGAPVLVTVARLAAAFATRPPAARPLRVVRLDADPITRQAATAPDGAATPQNLAYVLYTSGSTGRPKGVMIRHGSLVNLLFALDRAVYGGGATRPLRVGLNAPLAFDASVKQVIQLCRGHRLAILGEEERLDGARLAAYLEREAPDVLDLTPAQLGLLLDAGLRERPELAPRRLLVGGEAVDAVTWKLMASSRSEYHNVYGPTECTVDATVCRAAELPRAPSIGRPVANTGAYVLDQRLRPVPVAAAGELALAGPGLARGYLGRPGRTAASFVPGPFGGEPGGRLYRTGDLVRWRAGAHLEFLGRRDHQVKIRGVRLELGEIEARLAEHPAVKETVVAVRDDGPGGRRLVAYVVPRRRYAATVDGRPRYVLPNGMAVVHQNRNETDYLYREIFEARCYLQHGIELPDDACVFDVGANIGMFALFVLNLRPRAAVFAFEPIAPIFETLRLNAELAGGGPRLFPFGLAERESAAVFTFYPRYSMMSGLEALADPAGEVEVIKRFLDNARRSGDAGAEVLLARADELLEGRFQGEAFEGRLRRLSDVIRQEGVERIDLLKVDVQRAELDVLRGLDDEDWPKVRQVVMEVHDAGGPRGDGHVRDAVRLLEGRGFEARTDQDELLAGTDRCMLYAWRPGAGEPRPRPPAKAGSRERAVPCLLSVAELREDLRRKLPESMVPAAFVVLDALPVTSRGKVDRRSLPAPEKLKPELAAEYVAPRSRVERTIAEIWQRVLQVDKVGVHDSFFDLGGHSLLLVEVHSLVQEALACRLSMLDMFQHPTIGDLAGLVSEEGGGEPDSLQGIDVRARKQVEAIRRRRLAVERARTS